MTKEELEMLTKEEQEQIQEEEFRRKPIIFKCKPTFNFQSVEFEYEVTNEEEWADAFDIYSRVLEELMYLAPEQPTNVVKGKTSKEPKEPATEAQLKILKSYNIKHSKYVSKQEASELIKKSMAKSVKHPASDYYCDDYDDE